MAARRGGKSDNAGEPVKHLHKATALILAAAVGARAEDAPKAHAPGSPSSSSSSSSNPSSSSNLHLSGGHSSVDTGWLFFDIFLNFLAIGVQAAAYEEALSHAPAAPLEDSWGRRIEQGGMDDDDYAPPRWTQRARPRHDARQGLLLSIGFGGGSMFVTGDGRTGAVDMDFRLGYGFSDRFQLFGDVSLDAANYQGGQNVASWTLTMRGQTVLVGDRAGNGLNLNLGIGLGGVTHSYDNSYDSVSSPSGLALVGGLSYDARIGPFFALSPEFFATWHNYPDRPGYHGHAASYGLRLNLLWYLY